MTNPEPIDVGSNQTNIANVELTDLRACSRFSDCINRSIRSRLSRVWLHCNWVALSRRHGTRLDASSRFKQRIVIVAGVMVLLGAATAAFLTLKLRDDPEVINDINRHFESIGRYAPTEDDYRDIPGEDREDSLDPSPKKERRIIRRSRSEGAGESKSRSDRRRRKARGTRRGGESPTAETAPVYEGTREVGQGSYVLDQQLVTAVRASPRSFTGQARVRIVERDGEPAGFEVRGIRVGSLLHAIGVRSGDVISAVNGHSLKSVDEALLAVAAVRSSDRFRVDIMRSGSPRSLYYLVK
ncbi:MAG: hypothetical protein GY847_32570 [Proteobacteria bacterium]|nr:hypothetical protein [Pseudomonadota bacterium]